MWYKNLGGMLTRHKAWFGAFWCEVAATVLGIVLTFGVSEWMDDQKAERNAAALVERSFKNLELRLADIDASIQSMNRQDSLLIICTQAFPDKIDSVPDEVFRQLISIMCVRRYSLQSTAVETGFQQDINSQKLLGDFADILSDAFEAINHAEASNERINEHKIQFERIGTHYWMIDESSMTRQQCIQLLSNPDAIFLMGITSTEAQLMRRISRYVHNYIQEAHALWNKEISYDEFVKRAVRKSI